LDANPTLQFTLLDMSNDPVQQIKEEEAKASQKLEETAKRNHGSLDDHKIKKEKELENHKADLRAKGQESLEKAKQNAMAEFKKITEDEDRNRSAVISSASSKKDEAVKIITQAFEKHLT
jgi:vacuolar-type H+-ATPase subunit H